MDNTITNMPPTCKKCGKPEWNFHISNINTDYFCNCPKVTTHDVISDLKTFLGDKVMEKPSDYNPRKQYVLTKLYSADVYPILINSDTKKVIEWVLSLCFENQSEFMFTEVKHD